MDKLDKKELIMAAALELFAERGYHGTPVSLIAEQAKVGSGTIYRYFKDKDDLVNTLYRHWKRKYFLETTEEIETEPEATVVVEQPAAESVESESPVAEPVVEDQPTDIPTGPTRHVYGKITLSDSGEQLGGVNIMVPGSASAKVSNPNGGYTIEVPESARELVFIYRGKKLIKRIDPDNSLVNVVLNLETMQYD